MFKSMLCSQLLRNTRSFNPVFKRNKYYVLLPQIPHDLPENNPLLRTSSLPAFSELTTEKCINAIGKLVIEYESGIHKLSEKLCDPNLPKTPENVIMPLDALTVPLDYAWGTFKLLYIIGKFPSIEEAYLKLYPRILKAKSEQYLSLPIYHAFKELKVNEKLLAEPVQRIVDKHLLESKLSGTELADYNSKKYINDLRKINEHKNNYREKLMQCTAKFVQSLSFEDVQNFPKDFLCQIAADPRNPMNGPWNITLSPVIFQKFMENCENRTLRWNVWHAKNVRASIISGRHLNNSIEIEELRHYRKEQANTIGYKTFAEMSMSTKMAGMLSNVLSMISTLKVKSRAVMLKEIDELQEFANSQGCQNSLQLWDIPFWQKKHKEHLFEIKNEAIQQYFPLPAVLNGLFEFCQKLFNITIVKGDKDVETWHKDVSFYYILNQDGNQIATFYLDPYARPNEKAPGAWMEIGRNRSDVCGMEPMSYLVFNFQPPETKIPSLLTFDDLKLLLQKFGHMLQHSLTTMPYTEVAGISNLEWDVVHVSPLFMSSWLSHYKTIASFSSHIETGCKIPEEIHMKLVKSQQYMSALRLNEELYLAALDLEIYSSSPKVFWADIMKRLWLEYVPFPMEKYQAHVCSFPQIFCNEYPAAYFSLLWSEMIAADVYSAFKEVGLDNDEAITAIGQRFRETFLSLGGGCYPSEVFRRFRGRDPSTDALLSRYGLNVNPFVAKKSESREL